MMFPAAAKDQVDCLSPPSSQMPGAPHQGHAARVEPADAQKMLARLESAIACIAGRTDDGEHVRGEASSAVGGGSEFECALAGQAA